MNYDARNEHAKDDEASPKNAKANDEIISV